MLALTFDAQAMSKRNIKKFNNMRIKKTAKFTNFPFFKIPPTISVVKKSKNEHKKNIKKFNNMRVKKTAKFTNFPFFKIPPTISVVKNFKNEHKKYIKKFNNMRIRKKCKIHEFSIFLRFLQLFPSSKSSKMNTKKILKNSTACGLEKIAKFTNFPFFKIPPTISVVKKFKNGLKKIAKKFNNMRVRKNKKKQMSYGGHLHIFCQTSLFLFKIWILYCGKKKTCITVVIFS